MKLFALTASTLFPFLVTAITFSFNTFGQTSCQGFEENVFITQSGSNVNNFPGARKSIEIIKTDGQCALIIFTEPNLQGTGVSFGNQLSNGECVGFADGSSFQSFDVQCP
ncbi:uncharacterized protein K441DRAFT_699420 [Cenococcum geophilum 1.58]|uniref:uncharacterized protein n=1 Tax=Cenococcum geophilum 1.58 TaxID=794803 RepID=UPI00358FDFB1|nr:hypothetical protein K441DRAFT_699420 [Cenococcum geophilum 1.58]